MNVEIVLLILTVGLSAALLSNELLRWLEVRSARRRFASERGVELRSLSVLDSTLKPMLEFAAPFFSWVGLKRHRTSLEKKIAQAALDGYSPEMFWSFQVISALFFVILLLTIALELRLFGSDIALAWWAYAVAAFCGLCFPYLWLGALIKGRHESIKQEFASFVTNLTLTVEAGMDFISAVMRITKRMGESPLRDELARMLSEIQIGSSRANALRNFAQRTGVPEVSTFALVLIQADRFGTSIGQALRAQAARLRQQRFEAAERKGALASQKLIFPLVLFIMPSVLVVVFGPIIVKFMTGGLNGLFM